MEYTVSRDYYDDIFMDIELTRIEYCKEHGIDVSKMDTYGDYDEEGDENNDL